jgi:hypothetical protein
LDSRATVPQNQAIFPCAQAVQHGRPDRPSRDANPAEYGIGIVTEVASSVRPAAVFGVDQQVVLGSHQVKDHQPVSTPRTAQYGS